MLRKCDKIVWHLFLSLFSFPILAPFVLLKFKRCCFSRSGQPSVFFKLDHCVKYLYSRDLIGLAVMVYEPVYDAREIVNVKLSSGCSCKAKSARFSSTADRWLIWLSTGLSCKRSRVQIPVGLTLRVLKYLRRKCCLCNYICK